jgi:CBS domain containing-hemolysin-like protein
MSVIASAWPVREGVVALAAFVGAGFFSTLYAALQVTQNAGLKRLAEKYPKADVRVERYAERWDQLRAAALACTGISTVLALVALALGWERASALSPWFVVVLLLALPPLLLLGLVVMPRVVAEGYADLISIRMLPVTGLLAWVLLPLTWPLAKLEQRLLTLALSGGGEEDRPSHEDEIRHLVDQVSEDDLDVEEREMIKSVFEFGETITREIMTPRVDLEGFERDMTVSACVERAKDSTYSRFPVYGDTIDEVVGVVHIKDLLRLSRDGQGEESVGEVAKEVSFVPESMPINDLLRLLRAEKEQLAIVVDEYGGTAGLVAMEDIIEELVGEILDEYDTESMVMQRMADGSAVVDARMPVDEVNQLLELDLPKDEEYDSLGGYVFHALGHIPRPGESLETDQARITIQSATVRQLQTLRIAPRVPTDNADT